MVVEFFKCIALLDRECLKGPCRDDEVIIALLDLGGDNALGLDCFSMAF